MPPAGALPPAPLTAVWIMLMSGCADQVHDGGGGDKAAEGAVSPMGLEQIMEICRLCVSKFLPPADQQFCVTASTSHLLLHFLLHNKQVS